MAYVFISYSHKDKEYARKLAAELERKKKIKSIKVSGYFISQYKTVSPVP